MDYSKLFKYRPEDNTEIENVNPSFDDNNDDDSADSQQESIKRFRMKVLFTVIAVSLLIVFYVSNVVRVKSYLKEESKLEKQLDDLKNQNNILIMKINQLESPERITEIAVKKFGMIKTDSAPKALPKK